jgi:uncharacterized SAM-binding protein YcdF (DUF218 family)
VSVKISIGLSLVAISAVILLPVMRQAGSFLVVQHLHKADVIVVLGGDVNDRRYWKGMELLRNGYGRDLLVDAVDQTTMYGHTYAEWAQSFVEETNSGRSESVKVCPIGEDSTIGETKYVQACLADAHAQSVLLVTSDFHTRRAASIFRNRLPMYTWYVAAADDSTQFGARWWTHREWAKRAAEEWQKLLWWNLAERWLPRAS